MRKAYLSILFLYVIVAGYGQTETVPTQSVSLNLLGLQYNYEYPLSEKFTVICHAGLAGEIGYSSLKIGSWYEDSGWMYSLRGNVGTDFRYYYNLAKRERKGKSTYRNSGNFWAIDVNYFTPAIVAERFNSAYIVFASPYWGIRRVYKSNLFFEFNLGLNIGIVGGEWGIGRKTDIKFGYTF